MTSRGSAGVPHRAIVERSPMGVFVVQGDQVVYANRVARRQVPGLSDARDGSVTLAALVYPADLASVHDAAAALAAGERDEARMVIRFGRDEQTAVAGDVSLFADEHGPEPALVFTIVGMEASSSPVARLVDSERLHASVIDSVAEIILVIDSDYRVRLLNDTAKGEFRAALGIDLEVGSRIIDLVPPDMATSWRSRYDRGLAGETFEVVDELVTDEFEYHSLVRIAPFVTAAGDTEVLVVSRNVTETRVAENKLRDSEQRLRFILDTMTEGVALNECIFDDDGQMVDYRVLMVNRAFFEVAAYAGGSPIGRTAQELYGMTPEMINGFWVEHRDSTSPRRVEMPAPRGDRWFAVSTSPILDGLFVTSFSDITERKQRVAREMSLLEELHQSQKLEVVGRLASGIAHDFNNVLAAIMAHGELALRHLRGDHHERIEAELEGITATTERAAALTRRLLSFSHGGHETPTRAVDVNQVIREVTTTLSRLVGEAIAVEAALAADAPVVHVSAGQLDQILLNLVVNARDAITGDGTIVIASTTASARPDGTTGDYVVLSVADDGCGMTDDVVARIFEPFFTTKPDGLGTGLGLSTVARIVEGLQGAIDVTSRPGSGSEFRVFLPVHRTTVASSPDDSVAGSRRFDKVVLYVEDDALLRRVGCRLMETVGLTVLAAACPSEALELAARAPTIDILVSDVVMPEMNGFALYQRLAENHPGLPKVFASGYSSETLDRSGVGDCEVLSKPFNAQQLFDAIERALGGSS